MFDFCAPGWTRGDKDHRNHKGMITADRKVKKDVFYYYKANWSDEPVAYITSRRHVNRDQKLTPVKVYSNCSKVSVSLNGKPLPSIESQYNVYEWQNIELQEGQNTVQLTAEKDGRQYTDHCVWTYMPKSCS